MSVALWIRDPALARVLSLAVERLGYEVRSYGRLSELAADGSVTVGILDDGLTDLASAVETFRAKLPRGPPRRVDGALGTQRHRRNPGQRSRRGAAQALRHERSGPDPAQRREPRRAPPVHLGWWPGSPACAHCWSAWETSPPPT